MRRTWNKIRGQFRPYYKPKNLSKKTWQFCNFAYIRFDCLGWDRDYEEAARVHASRPALDSDLRLLLWVALVHDRVFAAHGVVREGPLLTNLWMKCGKI